VVRMPLGVTWKNVLMPYLNDELPLAMRLRTHPGGGPVSDERFRRRDIRTNCRPDAGSWDDGAFEKVTDDRGGNRDALICAAIGAQREQVGLVRAN
jgi:hypothetical protein